MGYTLQQLLNSLPLAALYAVLAFGYSVSFALTKRADLTYGALFAFSGHSFLLGAHWGWNLLFLTFAASLMAGAVLSLLCVVLLGMAIGRLVITPLAAKAPNAFTVASLGLLLALMETARLASNTQELWLPPFLNRPLEWSLSPFGSVTITQLQLVNSLVLIAILCGGALFLARSRWGQRWRALSEDRQAAALCGVSASAVCTQAYALSALLAAISGILATMHYGTMGFAAGLIFGLKVVLIAAAGGHFHPVRSAMGAAAIGVAETLWSGFGPIIWRDAAILSALALLLVVTRREREVV